ncbi:hypothetical protein BT69DRAFT_1335347 [Atractiella rhizophila]|nr:hypothetical protein BT69DRAFT_1335347 [Atractiella rhizophila]
MHNPQYSPSAYSYPYASSPAPSPSPRPPPSPSLSPNPSSRAYPDPYASDERETLHTSPSPRTLHRRMNSLNRERQGSYPPSYSNIGYDGSRDREREKWEKGNGNGNGNGNGGMDDAASIRSSEYNYAAWNRVSSTSTNLHSNHGGNLSPFPSSPVPRTPSPRSPSYPPPDSHPLHAPPSFKTTAGFASPKRSQSPTTDAPPSGANQLPRVFSPNEPIDPTTLTPEQLKVYKTFCNKEIDKEGPLLGYRQQLKKVRYGKDVEWGKLLKSQFGTWKNLRECFFLVEWCDGWVNRMEKSLRTGKQPGRPVTGAATRPLDH